MAIAIGIDLGTTNTVIAAVRDGVAATLADTDGGRLIPSVVSFHPNGNVVVGRGALGRRLIDPENTIYSVKRLIGRPWSTDEVQRAREKLPFLLKEGSKHAVVVEARGEDYTLPEVSAFVLRFAKASAEAALGTAVERAVITVPANFNDLQRAATKVAGKLAGLDVLRILNEPTAAALAYGQGQSTATGAVPPPPSAKAGERVAVYDLGGGTFDITVLDLSGNVFEVLATAGDMQLGGDDFDQLIMDRMQEELLKKHRYDARSNPQALGRLRVAAEGLKCALSAKEEATVSLDDVAYGEGGTALPFSFRMTRPELEWASVALVDRTFSVCQQALGRSNLNVGQIDRVILVGGSTRMPLVGRKVEQFFKKPPVMRVNPDEVVALGAAIQASALDRGGKRRAAPAAASPAISEASMSGPPPAPAPSVAAGPDRRHHEAPPELPLVTAPTRSRTSTQAGVGSGSLPVFDKAAARLDPFGTSRPGPAAPSAPEPPNAIPITMGDLDAELPVPDLDVPPPPPRARGSVAGPPPARVPVTDFKQTLPLTPAAAWHVPVDAPSLPAEPVPPPPAPAKGQSIASTLADVKRSVEVAGDRAAQEPEVKAPLLIDVTPLSLSVETVGGFCDVLIDCNTPVPCDKTRVFLTAADNQTAVFVRVAQGESKRFGENTFLGELELSGLAPARRGETQIAVTFEIDRDGILQVRARDVRNSRETRARMHLFGQQTEDAEIAAMHARQARHAVE